MSGQVSIYVIGTARGPKKIGISHDPNRRCAALNASTLGRSAVLYSREVPALDAERVEGHAHHLLASRRIKGEWFKTTLSEARAAVDASADVMGDGEQATRTVGRKKQWTERLTLPLTKDTVDAMDAALADGEVRLDLIREAIRRELRRREKAAHKPPS